MKPAAGALRGDARIRGMTLRLPTISRYVLAALLADGVIGCATTNLASNAMLLRPRATSVDRSADDTPALRAR